MPSGRIVNLSWREFNFAANARPALPRRQVQVELG
jgi:hypothetical protein